MVITFKYPKNKSAFAMTNNMVRCVVGASIKEIKKQIGSKTDSAFYQNVSRHFEDFVSGDYFAIKTETSYVFAFVSKDRREVRLKFRESNNSSYQVVSYKLELSGRNQDCYVINTKNNEEVDVVKAEEVQAQEVEVDEITRLKAELAAAHAKITKQAAIISKLEVKEEQQTTLITKLENKRRYSAKSAFRARSKMKFVLTLHNSGLNPVEVMKTAKNAENELESLSLGLI